MIADPWPRTNTGHGFDLCRPGGWQDPPGYSAYDSPTRYELSYASVCPSPGCPGVLLGLAVLDTLPLCVLLVQISFDPSPLPRLGSLRGGGSRSP